MEVCVWSIKLFVNKSKKNWGNVDGNQIFKKKISKKFQKKNFEEKS
jgi:hypothetical protein